MQAKSKIVKLKKKAKPAAPKATAADAARPTEEFKMVLCVNEALKMGKGKIGAQCAHAALGVTQQNRVRHEASFRHWERHGQAKIALKINDDNEMVRRVSNQSRSVPGALMLDVISHVTKQIKFHMRTVTLYCAG